MAQNKDYNPKEVAEIVLKKTQELLKNAALEKAEKAKLAEKSDKAYEVEAEKAKGMNRIESQLAPQDNPKEKKEENNKPAGIIRDHMKKSEEHMKGHHKLKSFLDQHAMKKTGQYKSDNEKGVHRSVDRRLAGISIAGGNLPAKGDKEVLSASKEEHKKVINEQKKMPKPKLPG